MIGDKEVVLSELTKFTWAIDIIKHTSDDTTELVEGWVLGDEYKALALYDEKVREITKEAMSIMTKSGCRLIAKIAAHMELTPEQQCVLIEHLKKADIYGFDGDKFYDWIRKEEIAIEEGDEEE